MTTPKSGLTHHLVFHLGGGVICGAIVKPFTYRVTTAPTFIPRFSQGNPKGIDKTRWKSYIQSRFDGGAGQLRWNSPASTNRFAESHLVDLHVTGAFSVAAKTGDSPLTQPGVQLDPEDTLYGDFAPAIVPYNSITEEPFHAAFFTNDMPVYTIEMSNRPHMWTSMGAFVYTNVTDTMAWISGSISGSANKMTGVWAVIDTNNVGNYTYDAVKYSGVVIGAKGDIGIQVYGPTTQTSASFKYGPSYETVTHRLAVYDDKLWRSEYGKLAYLQPAVNTLDAVWSDYLFPGDPSVDIVHMKTFNGRLYIGKVDSLWVFDAGRVYEVENYGPESDPVNFSLMEVYMGALYYNIRHQLYRLTAGGLIERIEMPITEGAILSGTSIAGQLYMLTRQPGMPVWKSRPLKTYWNPSRGETAIWSFNRESGGSRKWLSFGPLISSLGLAPRSINSAFGLIWISPVVMSNALTDTLYVSPVATADVLNPVHVQKAPVLAKSHSWLQTSALSFGHPHLKKLFNKLKVGYNLGSSSNKIDVFYKLQRNIVSNVAEVWATSGLGGQIHEMTANLIDGDLETQELVGVTNNGNYEYLLIGFKEKPSQWGLAFNDPYAAGWYHFWNMNDEMRQYFISDALGTALPFWPDGDFERWLSQVPEPDGGWSYRYAIMYGLTDPSRWEWYSEKTMDILNAYGGTSTVEDRLYWILLEFCKDVDSPSAGSTFDLRQVIFGNIRGPGVLDPWRWTSLGSITGSTDASNLSKTFNFADGVLAEEILLKFDMVAGRFDRPIVNEYELEYIIEPSNLEIIDTVVVAVDNAELLNGTRENSGAYVAATLFSMAKSGLTHVVEVPWPTPHTIRAKVSIQSPGAFIPEPVTNSLLAVGSEIPIRLDEL